MLYFEDDQMTEAQQIYNKLYLKTKKVIPISWSPWYETLIRMKPDFKEKRVLEVGCGTGRMCAYVAKKEACVVGIDFSINALRIAKKIFRNEGHSRPIELCLADANVLPFRSDVFDVIICCEVLEHLQHHGKLLWEISRVTKPRGTVYISTPNSVSLYGVKKMVLELFGKFKSWQPYYGWLSIFRFKKLIRDNRFKIIKIYGCDYVQPGLGYILWKTQNKFLEWLFDMFGKKLGGHFPINHFGLHTVIICIK